MSKYKKLHKGERWAADPGNSYRNASVSYDFRLPSCWIPHSGRAIPIPNPLEGAFPSNFLLRFAWVFNKVLYPFLNLKVGNPRTSGSWWGLGQRPKRSLFCAVFRICSLIVFRFIPYSSHQKNGGFLPRYSCIILFGRVTQSRWAVLFPNRVFSVL